MNADLIIEDAVKAHNRINPDIIIRRNRIGAISWYFLFCEDSNIWGTDECRLFMYLCGKLSLDRIYPFICLLKIDGEDKIGIFIAVNSEL